ncbi:MAG: hypothetical protein LCI00_02215 [Chloroflexi bacterium]|nr:hypothetical protein [Chloroflexota bacterium]MCC6895504.1 hypothetical protein [Anaerolineae bacterium]
MVRAIRAYIAVMCLSVSACQVLNAPNAPATLIAENTAYAVEATNMPVSIGGTAVAVAGTAVAAQTQISDINSVNRQLQATLNAVIPPTARPQIGSEGSIAATQASITGGGVGGTTGTGAVSVDQSVLASGTVLVDLAVTERKRDSDGCADGTSTQFGTDAPIIYAIARATSIGAGAVVSVDWKYQSQSMSSGSYTLPTDQSNFCIWFPLDAATIPFTAGAWSVRFLLNGQPVEPTVFFNIG